MEGTRWMCIDTNSECFGLIGTITYGETNPEYNGDGGVEIKYDNGDVLNTKLRRFVRRHTLLPKEEN